MSYYITDSIYILNNKTYYETNIDENENQKSKKIKLNKSNWLKYLSSYGWERLCLGWRKRLDENTKNSCYGVLECGADGDCLFHVISESLNSQYIFQNNFNSEIKLHDVSSLRKLVSEQITDENYNYILNNYIIEKSSDEFHGEWEPENINRKEDLQKEIQTCGNNFWGDHILLQLLQKVLDFNVIIMNSDNYTNSEDINDRYLINSLCDTLSPQRKTIIIYFFEEFHFQLIGYFDGNVMKTLFDYDELPENVLKIYNLDTRKTTF